ncbi:hypothetical protein EVAR_74488_1 [Eumeta japonica]|uniref:Uncharacterized protein n=1 Tax=Eumeta variegata TaxID=151549 RepID=A0A4C1TEW9_EUMVA|nr:hypothetical protein EVAR_74488_1 [Eumeta japonica]
MNIGIEGEVWIDTEIKIRVEILGRISIQAESSDVIVMASGRKWASRRPTKSTTSTAPIVEWRRLRCARAGVAGGELGVRRKYRLNDDEIMKKATADSGRGRVP